MKKYPVNANKHKGRPKQVPRAVLRHLEITRKEVQRLIHFYEVFMEFNDIAMQSTVAKKESEFWTFAKLSFGGEIVHRIDRLCEKKPAQKKWKVHSLLALLEELKAYAHLINREQYVGVVPNTAEAFAKKYPDEFDPPDCYFFSTGTINSVVLRVRKTSHLLSQALSKTLESSGGFPLR